MPAFPTLSRAPNYPIDPDGEMDDVILRSPMESGYEQTRPRTTRTQRSFGLNYRDLNDADEALLRTFETTTLRNGADSFTWTHPKSGTTYTVRLKGPIKYSRKRTFNSLDVSMLLREV